MHSGSSYIILWGLIFTILTGTLTVAFVSNAFTGREPPLSLLAVLGGFAVMSTVALILGRPFTSKEQKEEEPLAEGALQELLVILRETEIGTDLSTHAALLYGIPYNIIGHIRRDDTPYLDMANIVHRLAEYGPVATVPLVANIIDYLGPEHPKMPQLLRWKRTWMKKGA
jgi:hypothetical protein